MTVFDVSPASADYPEKLRAMRQQLGLSQYEFAEQAGYSAVMQGRYETSRSKPNSATPSPKTVHAIAAMIEAAWAKRQGGAVAPIKSLKSFSPAQFEQAVRSALGALTGTPYQVTIKDVVYEAEDQRMALSLVVSQEPTTA